MNLIKGIRILAQRLRRQGLRVTTLWAADHAVRIVTGAPLAAVSRITPALHVGGQYRRRGWSRLAARGITAVINMRSEFDDAAAGIAPQRYLYLSTPDDHAPELEQLAAGAAFAAAEIARGGAVFIHCGSGVGRAPTMAAACLISAGQAPEQAWASITSVRPFIRPAAVQLERIEQFAAWVRATAGSGR